MLLFVCFIDFQKAFDYVDYWLLFYKLYDGNSDIKHNIVRGYLHLSTAHSRLCPIA